MDNGYRDLRAADSYAEFMSWTSSCDKCWAARDRKNVIGITVSARALVRMAHW